ncbi:MAG: replication initiation protein [Prevotella sp.]|nr:replication initiation protein [Prevotella sp.]
MNTTEKEKDSIRDLILLQPDNMTFGQYNVSELQDNILTLIYEQLHKHMTREQPVSCDLFEEPYVKIKCDEAGGKNNKSKVLKGARDLMNKVFNFRWVHPHIHRTMETSGIIITTIHNDVGTNFIRLNFNKWAIPFLIYYGKGVGGTFFKKSIVLKLRGDKTKRIYKIICSQADQTVYDYPIKQFRQDFEIDDKRDNYYIKQKILVPVRDRIKESSSDVWFDFELITKYKKDNGCKPMADTIRFLIKSTKATDGTPQRARNEFVLRWLGIALEYDGYYVEQAFNSIMQSPKTDEIYNRFAYWDKQITSGEKTTQHVKNSIRKLLRDDFNIKVAKPTKGRKK